MSSPFSSRPADAPRALLRAAHDVVNQRVRGVDGTLGRVVDLYFEVPTWTARYALVDAARAPGERAVLLPTDAIRPGRGEFHAEASRAQVDRAPAFTAEHTLSRADESALRRHFGWPEYWRDTDELPPTAGSNFHSVQGLAGCSLHALDGDLGRVSDVLVDSSWSIRYLAIATHAWLATSHVIIATAWIAGIDWGIRRLLAEVDRATVRSSPPYDPARPLAPEYVARLHFHYRKPVPGTSTPPPALL